ncbi:MAG TPA: glycosyltransferase family 2 protein [Aggregatilineales bacterium]|nr:glycosyltransferase family 2 protein [Aggregatilineales bacterium]
MARRTIPEYQSELNMIQVILPAYNEEEALPCLLSRLADVRAQHGLDLRALVVDDGSQDRTAAVVQEASASQPWIRLVPHARNMGLSQGLRTGFRTALAESRSPDDVIITIDADNTQPPELIPAMVEAINGGKDVVIASRFQPGAEVHGVPASRRLFSFGMSVLFRTVFPIRGVRDFSCGFRAYRAGTLQRAHDHYGEDFITEQGFACMVEVLFQLDHLGGVRFGEVPMVLHYDYKPTETKMNVGKTIRDTLGVAYRMRIAQPRGARRQAG